MSFKSMGFWRVALAASIYGGLYAGYKGYAPWWLLGFLVPFFLLFRPVPDDICEFKKAWEAGFIFYLFKWGLISMTSLLLLVGYYTFFVIEDKLSFIELAQGFVKNSFVIVPLFLSIFTAWSINKRHYLAHCHGKDEKSKGHGHKKKKKKRKK